MRWLGLDNYADILSDPDVWHSMQVTAHFVLWTIVLQVLLGLGLALLINRKFRGHGLWTTVILVPMMLSPAVVGNFWTFLFQPQTGIFNYAVGFVTGIDPHGFQMLGDIRFAPWAIVLVDTWMWTPYVMLICLAGLRSIPEDIYEAAEVDRASPLRQFWTITLPMVLPFLMLAVLFAASKISRCSTWSIYSPLAVPAPPPNWPPSPSNARRSRNGVLAIRLPLPSSFSSPCSVSPTSMSGRLIR